MQQHVHSRTLRSAVAHIITAVIGAGVLSLAWSTSQLGWIAGPVSLLLFAIVTYISSFLLSDCYRTPDPVSGKRNYSYMDAVRVYLGSKRTYLVGFLQYLTLYGTCIAYVITTASCIRAILKSNCYHKEGHKAPCKYVDTLYLMLFGVVQIVMSFIPDLHNMAWVSVVAALMSFTYATIGLGLGITTVIENGRIMGSITGVAASNTLEAPPSENKTMKKASMIAIFITTFFYLCCGCFGYAAFGDQTPGNLLTGFGFYEPYWLIDFANACIVLHLIGGYQMVPKKIPKQTTYVVSTTGLGILFLYFNQVLGVLGAISFWPLAIYFPVEMYFVQKKIEAWSRKWIVLRIFGFVCFLVPVFGLIGSLEGIISAKLSS
ncbi:hypothetical protein AAHE18_03G123500 [Arachis hypogaea]